MELDRISDTRVRHAMIGREGKEGGARERYASESGCLVTILHLKASQLSPISPVDPGLSRDACAS
jgi:hypothetical protein